MCAIFGIVALQPVDPIQLLQYAYVALSDLQHRGHEWVGLATSNGEQLRVEKRAGRIDTFFADPEFMAKLIADNPQMLLAQLRFSTQGRSVKVNAQPHYIRAQHGGFLALGSNGDAYDYDALRQQLEVKGNTFIGRNDAEALLFWILEEIGGDFSRLDDGIVHLQDNVRASFSAWLASAGDVRLFRDRFANRPYFFMQVGPYLVFASEDNALNGVLLARAEGGYRDGTVAIKQVRPGEVIHAQLHGAVTQHVPPRPQPQLCRCEFERVYLARPDSSVFGTGMLEPEVYYRLQVVSDGEDYAFQPIFSNGDVEDVMSFRVRLGKRAGLTCPAPNAACVLGIPESGNPFSIGFAGASGLPYKIGYVRNQYIGRTFISPGRENREVLAVLKHRPLRSLFQHYPSVVIGDDSIIYGTTMQKLMRMTRAFGAREIHLRISCPPVQYACRYGIDMSSKGALIASVKRVDELAKQFNVASVEYLPMEDFLDVIGPSREHSCLACWNNDFRI